MAVNVSDTRKLVLFGAGRIGRSFIGQLFSRGGYEVVFIDTYKNIIDELNRCRSYNIIIKGEVTEVLSISNVRGVNAFEHDAVVEEIATAGILAISVGAAGLTNALPVIAKGLLKRYQTDPDSPLDIIIAENLRNASDYLKSELIKHLPDWYPIDRLVGLVETSIGKMVPIMQVKDIEEDALQVFAEPYNTLILDKHAFRNPIPEIQGLSPKNNMKAWVDRKLFIHNLGHATAAYLGYIYNPHFVYIYEALMVPELKNQVRETMLQAAEILLVNYPDEFTPEDLTTHIDDLLYRFQNKALGDTIYRVGCDLYRKLGPEDRLAGPVRIAIGLGLPYDKLLHALISGFYFRAKDENGNLYFTDSEFVADFGIGTEHILSNVCGFNKERDSKLFREAILINKRFQT